MWSANKIKQLRVKKRLTQSQLADMCGVAVTTVSRWELGISSPDNRSKASLDFIAKSSGKSR